MPQIFLCYASEDKTQVREVYQRLCEIEGFKPWLDEEDLVGGQLWEQEIPQALQASDFIVIFFSQNSIRKIGYVQNEFKLALDAWRQTPEGVIRTIPVRLETCDVPAEFRRFHWIDLFDEGGIERLVRAIRVGLAQRQQEPIPPPEAPPTTEPTTLQPNREPTQPSNDARIVPPAEDREETIRNHIAAQIEVLRGDPKGRVLYRDLTAQVPEKFLPDEIVRVIEKMRLEGVISFDGPFAPLHTSITLFTPESSWPATVKEYVWQWVEQFISEKYGLVATMVDFRDVPEGGVLKGEVPNHQFNTQQYALIFDVENMGRKILYIRRDHMENRMTEAQFRTRTNDYLSRHLPPILQSEH